MEIDDLITLKLFDKALKKINHLKLYDFHKYKAKLFMVQSYFEESVSHAIEMWKLCETIQESYVRPYYIFNCSYRNPQFSHFRVPVETGRDIVESMYGNISGDAVPRYIATAGGKIPLHRSNVIGRKKMDIIMKKPWNNEKVKYPDADPDEYANQNFSFAKQ